jgi:hypothetical protein
VDGCCHVASRASVGICAGTLGTVAAMSEVLIPTARFERWVKNFCERHGSVILGVADGALTGESPDGSSFVAQLPFELRYAGPPEISAFAAAGIPPATWAVLLVRKGGFAIAQMNLGNLVDSKVGRRHVQGRTKAGGQSQQRFARRRENQARQAFEAAADHAARLLLGPAPLAVIGGGDQVAVAEVLRDRRLDHLHLIPPWLPVPDPRRRELETAIAHAGAVRIEVVNR